MNMKFKKLHTLKKGDRVAVLSPSFAAPAVFPKVFEYGLQRVKDIFELEPVEYPSTRKLNASAKERADDLVAAFEDKNVKAVIASIGGDDQVTYIKNLPSKPFSDNPKPFFGYSDNTHFMNFLWLNGVPSFYGGSLMTQFAMQKCMDEYTVRYLKKALFERGEAEIKPSEQYNDVGLDWGNEENLNKARVYEPNDGWIWDSKHDARGFTWGGCLESIDEMMRNSVEIPSLKDFERVVLCTETSEEIPSSDYVSRVYRALGERGILERVKAVLVGRPKAWEFDKQKSKAEKKEYSRGQRNVIAETVRMYNKNVPIVQNLDFGHTDPQMPLPYGKNVRLIGARKQIFIDF